MLPHVQESLYLTDHVGVTALHAAVQSARSEEVRVYRLLIPKRCVFRPCGSRRGVFIAFGGSEETFRGGVTALHAAVLSVRSEEVRIYRPFISKGCVFRPCGFRRDVFIARGLVRCASCLHAKHSLLLNRRDFS